MMPQGVVGVIARAMPLVFLCNATQSHHVLQIQAEIGVSLLAIFTFDLCFPTSGLGAVLLYYTALFPTLCVAAIVLEYWRALVTDWASCCLMCSAGCIMSPRDVLAVSIRSPACH